MPCVLYLHGFEENLHSPKPQDLMQVDGIYLDCLAQDIYFTKPYSPLRYAVLSPVSALCGIGAYGAVEALSRLLLKSTGLALPGCARLPAVLVAFALMLFSRRKQLLARGISISFERTVLLAESAVAAARKADCPYDAVVGFSWGGGVACELLHRGLWSGPTLLLAPAYKKLKEMMRQPCADTLGVPKSVAEHVVVIHSKADTIVPFANSEALGANNGFRLIAVENEPHKMWGICGDGGPMRLALQQILTGRAKL